MMFLKVTIGMKAEKAAELFEEAAAQARDQVNAQDGPPKNGSFEFEIDLEPNGVRQSNIVQLVFSNDDMERDDMDRDRVLADWDEVDDPSHPPPEEDAEPEAA